MTVYWIPAALSGAADLVTALAGVVQGPGLVLDLATLVVQALRLALGYRLRAGAVAKADAGDLPGLFRAFAPTEAEPDPPGDANP
ncbi:hypothetical protein [Streptomyces nitrosporeus]|uniref:hypothetical protein n=1 Tax=Streptomyces nitrosporeus TaxID=28894 RepID=UPI00399F7601